MQQVYWIIYETDPEAAKVKNPFEIKELSIKKFFDGKFIYYRGEKLSRFEMIQYAATVLGAIHVFDSKDRDHECFQLMTVGANFPVADIYWCILGIAQDIMRSADVSHFRKVAPNWLAKASIVDA